MKEIIEAILACALASGSDVNLIDSIKEDYRKAFIKGEFNKAILEDIESIDVKGLNNLLNDILEADYPIEDKIKAIEQWDDIMTNYVKYMEELRDKTMEGYDNLCKKYHEKQTNTYSVFYTHTNLVILDKNNRLRNSFNGETMTVYEGNSLDEAVGTVEGFLKVNTKYHCVDYRKIYKD